MLVAGKHIFTAAVKSMGELHLLVFPRQW